jgi:hypothetical protein
MSPEASICIATWYGKLKGKRRNVKSDLKQEEMVKRRLIEGKGKKGGKVGRQKGGGGGGIQLRYRYIIWETHIGHNSQKEYIFSKGKGTANKHLCLTLKANRIDD